MNDPRKDAQSLELTAQADGSSDALQLDAADLAADLSVAGKKIPHQPKKVPASFDAKLFDALVAPPTTRTIAAEPMPEIIANELTPSPGTPGEGGGEGQKIEQIETLVTPRKTPEKQPEIAVESPEPEPELAPVILKMEQPQPVEVDASEADWEPLPPPMRMVAETFEPEAEASGSEVESSVIAVQPAKPIALTPIEVVEVHQPEVVEAPARLPIKAPAIELKEVYDPAAIEVPVPTESPVVVDKALTDAFKIREPAGDEEPEPVAIVEEPIVEEEIVDESTMPASRVELKAVAFETDAPVVKVRSGSWWTIPMLCAGLAIVACALLVPAADENRRAMHELAQIDQDVQYFQKQSEVNKEFLNLVSSDPTLAERLAMRQLRMTRADARIVDMPKKREAFSMSPYALVAIDPPVSLPEYRPLTGFLSKYFLDAKTQIYLAGIGILLAAAGVILGGGNSKESIDADPAAAD